MHDVAGEVHRILVTGSARLDVYRQGSDSLMGRYHYWRLHPFTLDEIPNGIDMQDAFQRLMTVGGFPEPFLAYVLFRVPPYSQNIARALIKPPKVYFFDNGDVSEEQGPRFENLVAATLLKRLHFLEDYGGHRCELRYIRDKEGREVDFAVIKDGVLEELIEVKYSDEELSPALRYFNERLHPPRATQIVATLDKPYDRDGIRITNPFRYFADNALLGGCFEEG